MSIENPGQNNIEGNSEEFEGILEKIAIEFPGIEGKVVANVAIPEKDFNLVTVENGSEIRVFKVFPNGEINEWTAAERQR